MKALTKVGAAWKQVRRIFIKQGTTWKPVKRAFVKVSGVWKQFYAAGTSFAIPIGTPGANGAYPEGFSGLVANFTPVPDPVTGGSIYYMLRNYQSAGQGQDALQIISGWGHQVTVQGLPTYFGPLKVTNLNTGVSLTLLNPGGGNPTWSLSTTNPDQAGNPHAIDPAAGWMRPNSNDTFLFERA